MKKLLTLIASLLILASSNCSAQTLIEEFHELKKVYGYTRNAEFDQAEQDFRMKIFNASYEDLAHQDEHGRTLLHYLVITARGLSNIKPLINNRLKLTTGGKLTIKFQDAAFGFVLTYRAKDRALAYIRDYSNMFPHKLAGNDELLVAFFEQHMTLRTPQKEREYRENRLKEYTKTPNRKIVLVKT